jgi:KUP system potassium uptake protein
VVLAFFVAMERWRWHPVIAGLITLLFLTVDLAFFGANMLKIGAGGWFPLAAGGINYLCFMLKGEEGGNYLIIAKIPSAQLPCD